MPAIQIYMTAEDSETVAAWLSDEQNIALISPTGEGKWQAFYDFDIKSPGRHCLFHDQCGPLPLLAAKHGDPDGVIDDPFAGWQELRAGANKNTPHFGPGHTGIFWFNSGLNPDYDIHYSTFEWIGNHYSILGDKAPEAASKWWGRLKRFVTKGAVKINTNGEFITKGRSLYWASPAAAEKIKAGAFDRILAEREERRKKVQAQRAQKLRGK